MTAPLDGVRSPGGLLAAAFAPPPAELHGRDIPLRELARGEALYRAGDAATTVYGVEEGLLKLTCDLATGRERVLHVAGPGDYVGAVAPLPVRHGESAVALSPLVRVRALSRDDLTPELLHATAAAAGLQLEGMRAALEDSELPVGARIARTFVRLGDRFGQRNGARVMLTLPITHDTLAAMIGAARETTTTTLTELRNEGLVSGTRGRYAFNADALRDYATAASL